MIGPVDSSVRAGAPRLPRSGRARQLRCRLFVALVVLSAPLPDDSLSAAETDWRAPLGTEHVLTGRIWNVASGRFIPEEALLDRLAQKEIGLKTVVKTMIKPSEILRTGKGCKILVAKELHSDIECAGCQRQRLLKLADVSKFRCLCIESIRFGQADPLIAAETSHSFDVCNRQSSVRNNPMLSAVQLDLQFQHRLTCL